MLVLSISKPYQTIPLLQFRDRGIYRIKEFHHFRRLMKQEAQNDLSMCRFKKRKCYNWSGIKDTYVESCKSRRKQLSKETHLLNGTKNIIDSLEKFLFLYQMNHIQTHLIILPSSEIKCELLRTLRQIHLLSL